MDNIEPDFFPLAILLETICVVYSLHVDHISAEEAKTRKDPRVPCSRKERNRQEGPQATNAERTKASRCLTKNTLRVQGVLSKSVYRFGKHTEHYASEIIPHFSTPLPSSRKADRAIRDGEFPVHRAPEE